DDDAVRNRSPEYIVAAGPDRSLEREFPGENNGAGYIRPGRASHNQLRMFVSRWIETDRPSGLFITWIARHNQLAVQTGTQSFDMGSSKGLRLRKRAERCRCQTSAQYRTTSLIGDRCHVSPYWLKRSGLPQGAMRGLKFTRETGEGFRVHSYPSFS